MGKTVLAAQPFENMSSHSFLQDKPLLPRGVPLSCKCYESFQLGCQRMLPITRVIAA